MTRGLSKQPDFPQIYENLLRVHPTRKNSEPRADTFSIIFGIFCNRSSDDERIKNIQGAKSSSATRKL